MVNCWRDALAAIDARHVDLVNIMYTEVSDIDACLDVVQAHWSKPVGVYAHTGHYIEAETRWVYDGISPVDYATAAQRRTRPAGVIVGCCGIQPCHIHEVTKVV
jgi:S-methylmethionine-dependent homocysteine/selenocysteine methylase